VCERSLCRPAQAVEDGGAGGQGVTVRSYHAGSVASLLDPAYIGVDLPWDVVDRPRQGGSKMRGRSQPCWRSGWAVCVRLQGKLLRAGQAPTGADWMRILHRGLDDGQTGSAGRARACSMPHDLRLAPLPLLILFGLALVELALALGQTELQFGPTFLPVHGKRDQRVALPINLPDQ